MILDYKSEINFYFDQYEKAENNKGDMLSGFVYMPEFLVSHHKKIKKCKVI